LYQQNAVNGNYLEIHEVYLFDSRQGGSIGTLYTLKNLYKPI
jgi:hypothetical protein